jgi:cytoskeleton protein RodZ
MSENLVMQDILSNKEDLTENSSLIAGQMLKKARTDAGLHIAALAVSLKVPVKRIEALESGQMDVLTDMVYVRALTSSICQTLKIDALPILDKLPKAALPRLNRNDVAINTPIGASGASKSAILSDIISSPWLMGVAFLCIAAAGIYFWPNTSSLAVSEAVTATKSAPLPDTIPLKEPATSVESVNSASVAPPASVVPVSVDAPVTAAVATAAVDVSLANSAANPSLPVDSIVVFKASAETWVEVKNATGNTVFKKLLIAGESAGASGSLPLTVIVGRADVTLVEVRGKPLDLTAIAKSNVARFEVN